MIKKMTEKITVREICTMIELPEEMAKQVCRADEELSYSSMSMELEKLWHPGAWEEGLVAVRSLLGEDTDGVKMLACMLHCAQSSYEEYRNKGIPDGIYVDTMKCFSRFVKEHYVSFGRYGFDRAFWTPRQLSLQLFRIGELEYELYQWEGQKAVSIHIPSDAKMLPERIVLSLQEAKRFMTVFSPEYAEAPFICDSWLLSPALKELLPESSNILSFQNRFELEKVEWEQMDVIEWVFKNAKGTLEELPEDTSLQRNMKAALLNGKKIGVALGVLYNLE